MIVRHSHTPISVMMASASTSVSCISSATAVASSESSAALQHHIDASIDFHLVVNATIQQRERSLYTQARTTGVSARTRQRFFTECTTVIDISSDLATPTDPCTPPDSDSDSDSSTPSPEQVEENRELEWNKFMRSTIGKLCPLTCPCRGLEASRRQERTNAKGKTIKKTKRAPPPPVPAQGSFTCSRCGTFGTPLRRCTLCGTASFGCHMSTMARTRRCRFSTTTSMSMSVQGETLGEPL